jgi:hypothetical protein
MPMKPTRLLAAGIGFLAIQAAFASDRVGGIKAQNSTFKAAVFEENENIPKPADVAHKVGVAGLHVVALAGIALSVMARRRKAGR